LTEVVSPEIKRVLNQAGTTLVRQPRKELQFKKESKIVIIPFDLLSDRGLEGSIMVALKNRSI